MIGLSHPLILAYLALCLENFSDFLIRQNVKSRQHFKPLSYQLISFLSCNETTLVAQLPDTLCIVLFIHIPIKRRCTIRVKKHQNFRQMAKAIEDVLTRVSTNVN